VDLLAGGLNDVVLIQEPWIFLPVD